MDSTKKSAVMSQLRNSKGFTLIEMAIVLVIIGIILGAVMKGQDLITNSKAKNIGAAANNWKALIFAFVDRNGKLPGDTSRLGYISNTVGHDAIYQLYSTMSQTPMNPVTVGGTGYYFYLTHDDQNKSVMVICNSQNCGTNFGTDDIELMKSIDSSIDGSPNAGNGAFRAASAVTTAPVAGNFRNDVARQYATTIPTITQANVSDTTAAPIDWGATATKAAVYYFDKPFK